MDSLLGKHSFTWFQIEIYNFISKSFQFTWLQPKKSKLTISASFAIHFSCWTLTPLDFRRPSGHVWLFHRPGGADFIASGLSSTCPRSRSKGVNGGNRLGFFQPKKWYLSWKKQWRTCQGNNFCVFFVWNVWSSLKRCIMNPCQKIMLSFNIMMNIMIGLTHFKWCMFVFLQWGLTKKTKTWLEMTSKIQPKFRHFESRLIN